MKALTLWQPWASFIAIGVKPFETRSWPPPAWLIGQRIAIHAAKRPVDADDREWACRVGAAELPLGAVVCTAVLRGAYQFGRAGPIVNPALPIERQQILALDLPSPALAILGTPVKASRRGSPPLLSIPADEFGDYYEDRWAWWLQDIESFNSAIPARGGQGIWDWLPRSEAVDG